MMLRCINKRSAATASPCMSALACSAITGLLEFSKRCKACEGSQGYARRRTAGGRRSESNPIFAGNRFRQTCGTPRRLRRRRDNPQLHVRRCRSSAETWRTLTACVHCTRHVVACIHSPVCSDSSVVTRLFVRGLTGGRGCCKEISALAEHRPPYVSASRPHSFLGFTPSACCSYCPLFHN